MLSFGTARVLASLAIILSAAEVASPAAKVIRRLDGSQIADGALTARSEDLVKKGQVHGLALAVFNDREPVYTRTFGVKRTDTKEPLRLDTPLDSPTGDGSRKTGGCGSTSSPARGTATRVRA